MKLHPEITILTYQKAYAPYFEMLNREWIEESYHIEEVDIQQFQNPEMSIVKNGGEIFFAKLRDEIIGTVALKKNHNTFELSKLAVSKNNRGLGAGEMLCRALIDKARNIGIKKLVLYSNSKQNAALNLYRKLGFVEVELEPVPWERVNVKMELTLKE
ncbi:MAG: GNAT family N-acetyltransferase [Chitinophagaceae bacterium]|nr:GNAT family N-acetyltransferase [Chitinophagaceae bacterium]MCO5241151.1 GNAT family N-acetyltransferase [Chitinophagaceae bacterium]